jgi:hypothetical protein
MANPMEEIKIPLVSKKTTRYERSFEGKGLDLFKLCDSKGGELNDKDHKKEQKETSKEG